MDPKKSQHWRNHKFICYLVLLAMFFSIAGGAVSSAPVYADSSDPSYNITLAPPPDLIWTVSADKAVAEAGETVTVTVSDTAFTSWATGLLVTGDSGTEYDFTTITAATGDANGVNGPGVYSFVMPDEPVTVDFTADYTTLDVYIQYGSSGGEILVHSYTRAEMESLAAANDDPIYYAMYDRMPAVFMGKAVRYVTIGQLAESAAACNSDVRFNNSDCSLRGASLDGWTMGLDGLSWDYLLGQPRSYYAGIGDQYLAEENRTGKDREVPAVLAITGWAGRQTEVDNQPYDTLNTYRFFYGQTAAEYGDGVLPTTAERDARCTAMNTSKLVNKIIFVVSETDPVSYTVTADSAITGGSIELSPAGGAAGDTIIVTVAPDAGKQLVAGSLQYTADGGASYTEITATNGVYSFTLPAANVTVTAQFEDLSSALIISSREELLAFAAAVNSGDTFEGRTVTLGGDIALDEDGLYSTADEYFQDGMPDYAGTFTVPAISAGANIWTPIGSSINQFKGLFDGGGHAISGLYTDLNASYQGLFGYIGPGGSVKNVTVSGVVAGTQYVGGIAGVLNGGSIDNAVNRAFIYASGGAIPGGSGTNRLGHAGGIFGMGTGTADAPVSISGCANYGTVTASNCNQGGRAGGIAGLFDLAEDCATISRCFNTAEIKAYQYAGGIVGSQFANNVTVSACYNTGAVTGTSSGKTYAGGIAGKSCGPVINCYNTGNIISTATSGNMPTRFAGIVGETESAGATITNCYTTGQVLHASAIGTSGNIVGSQAVSPVNCYYLDTNALSGAGDSTTTTARTTEELKAPAMPAALGTAFAHDSNNYNNGYPVLAWQNGSLPEPVSHAVTLSFDGAAATVSASAAEAAPGESVTITITDLAAGKRVQSVKALDANSVACPVTTVAENVSYTFTMGSSAVTVTVLFENISAGGEPYAYTVEPGIDPIWIVDVASSGLADDQITAGSTVTVTVTRMAGAIMASLQGLTIRDAHGGTVAAETISTTSGGYNTIGGGVYTFTMPESTVTIGLDAAYAELSIYTQAGGNGIPTLVKTYSREEMIALAGSQTIYYTGYDRYPTAVIGKAAQAVRLTDLLDDAGVNFGAGGTFELKALDESTRTYDYAALYGENRYYYPNIAAAENKDAGKTPVDPMLVIRGYQERFINFEPGQDIDDMVCDTLNAYRFVYGQTEIQFNGGIPLQENASVGDFLKYTCALTIVIPETAAPQYVLTPLEDETVYTVGETGGIKTMTVKEGAGGLKYFGTQITPVIGHEGQEAVVFTHLRDGMQLSINITRADFDLVHQAQAGFNVQAGDTIKVYIVDDLTNDPGFNPTLLQ